jgi:uncharacterized protein
VRRFGFRIVRVRHHDEMARLEVGADEMPRLLEPEIRDAVVRELTALGYQHVVVDLQGYRQGSLNQHIRLRPV